MAWETIITSTGRAPKIGTTSPGSEMTRVVRMMNRPEKDRAIRGR